MVFAKVKKNRRLRSTLSREKQKFGMYLFLMLHNYQFALKKTDGYCLLGTSGYVFPGSIYILAEVRMGVCMQSCL